MKPLTPAQRLIVAADFKPLFPESWELELPSSPPVLSAKEYVRSKVLALADLLAGTNVCLKVNSALGVCGYDLIPEIKSRGLGVFVDPKICDIPATLELYGTLLAQYSPDILTVMASAGGKAIHALVKAVPKTEVLGVTVLTSMDDVECSYVHGNGTSLSAGRLAKIAIEAGANGLICSGHEAEMLRRIYGDGVTLNCPGIRPSYVQVKNEDQKRMMTPAQAIRAGATRIVVGRPITEAPDPFEAVRRIIAEIEEALATLK